MILHPQRDCDAKMIQALSRASVVSNRAEADSDRKVRVLTHVQSSLAGAKRGQPIKATQKICGPILVDFEWFSENASLM